MGGGGGLTVLEKNVELILQCLEGGTEFRTGVFLCKNRLFGTESQYKIGRCLLLACIIKPI